MPSGTGCGASSSTLARGSAMTIGRTDDSCRERSSCSNNESRRRPKEVRVQERRRRRSRRYPDAEQPARPRRRWWLRTGLRGLLLAATVSAMLLLGSATLAHATGLNVVPNPGFEQAGCGADTPAICGWTFTAVNQCGGAGPCTFSSMTQDSNAHTGSASMSLFWGTDFSNGYGGAEAATDPAFCAQIGPGVHPVSRGAEKCASFGRRKVHHRGLSPDARSSAA
jgi:hypothetical protein